MDLDLDLDYLSQLPKDTKRHPALADIFTLKRVMRMTMCSKFYRDEGCCDLIQNLLISEHDYTSLAKNITSSPFGHEINAEKVKSEVLERLSARLNLLGSVRTVGLIANSKLFIQTTISLFKKLRLVENFYFAWGYSYAAVKPLPGMLVEVMSDFFNRVGRQLHIVSFSIVQVHTAFSAIQDCRYFGDAEMDLVTRCCPNVVRLQLPRRCLVEAQGWKLLGIRCDKLQYLTTGACNWEDGALSGLSKLKMLNIGAAMNDVMYSEAGKDPITKLAEFVAAQSPVPISKLHFLDHPAIVEAVDSSDPIPLIRSLMTNSNGIDINEPNSAGMTAVSRAVQRELDEVVNVLFEYGATFFGPQSRGDVCYLIAGHRFDLLRQVLKPYIDAGLRVPSSHLCTWDMASVFQAVQREPLAAYEAILQDDIMQALGIDAAYINASFAVRPHPLLKYMHQSPTIDILKLLVLKGYDLSGPVMQTGKTASDTVFEYAVRNQPALAVRLLEAFPDMIRPTLAYRPLISSGSDSLLFCAITGEQPETIKYLFDNFTEDEVAQTYNPLVPPTLQVAATKPRSMEALLATPDCKAIKVLLREQNAAAKMCTTLIAEHKAKKLSTELLQSYFERMIGSGALRCDQVPSEIVHSLFSAQLYSVVETLIRGTSAVKQKEVLSFAPRKSKNIVQRLATMKDTEQWADPLVQKLWEHAVACGAIPS